MLPVLLAHTQGSETEHVDLRRLESLGSKTPNQQQRAVKTGDLAQDTLFKDSLGSYRGAHASLSRGGESGPDNKHVFIRMCV